MLFVLLFFNRMWGNSTVILLSISIRFKAREWLGNCYCHIVLMSNLFKKKSQKNRQENITENSQGKKMKATSAVAYKEKLMAPISRYYMGTTSYNSVSSCLFNPARDVGRGDTMEVTLQPLLPLHGANIIEIFLHPPHELRVLSNPQPTTLTFYNILTIEGFIPNMYDKVDPLHNIYDATIVRY